jgi:hydroxymethylpyrimidine pyrophosphatase-like HAD family hydrolase
MEVLYLDLDGTLLGPSGSVVEDATGAWSADSVRALGACRARGVEVVLMSGRSRRTLAEDARLLGTSSYIAELGGCVVIDGEAHWLTGELSPSARDGTTHEQIAAAGAPALLVRRFGGRLEPHRPWHRGREVSHLFRGSVDVAEADALLAERGHGTLHLLDNGVWHGGGRVYHLLPRASSKAAGVALHRHARGHARRACVAVGDSPEDVAVAAQVGRLWLVANARAGDDPRLRKVLAAHGNVSVARGAHGAGVLEALRAQLGTG